MITKPFLLFRGPVETVSGYGAHSRDLLKSLHDMDMFDIRIDSCHWGSNPRTALKSNNEFHQWILNNKTTSLSSTPDIYVQVTVPNEFQRVGKFNIGITAGIETTMAPKEWVDGCNRMDLIIVTSTFSRDVLLQTVYNETDKVTGKLIKQHRIEKPISVLFEGVDTEIYTNKFNSLDIGIKEDFCYLFVGHWLKGDLGHDRKDVGMLIKCFVESFKDQEDQPALILKTSGASFSVKERESFKKKIKDLVKGIDNPPPIYLLFGQLTDEEMNELYNHPRIKSMVTLTKGEGFGRPLLEFSMTGKPIIASNWSGHKDFLPMDKAIMIGGSLTDVHSSVIDNYIVKGSKWFTANYSEFAEVLKVVRDDYDTFCENSQVLMEENKEKYSMEKMKEKFESIIVPHINKPKEVKLNLPQLTKL
jgi:glycosyltransferase involved in cell wall biosynthesis